MTPLTSLLASTDWLFVLVSVVMSMIVGWIWYHEKVFGNLYGRWMKMPKMVGETPEGIAMAFAGEILSRILYFIGLGQAFLITGWTSISDGLVLALVVWAIFVFPTQLSQISWTLADKKVLLLITGSALLQTLIAAVLWFGVFA